MESYKTFTKAVKESSSKVIIKDLRALTQGYINSGIEVTFQAICVAAIKPCLPQEPMK